MRDWDKITDDVDQATRFVSEALRELEENDIPTLDLPKNKNHIIDRLVDAKNRIQYAIEELRKEE